MSEANKIRVVFFGTPDFVIPIVDSIAENFDLVGVVTSPDTIQGRKKILTPSPVKDYIQKNHPEIPVITPEQFNDLTIEQLTDTNPDLYVLAAYGHLIPKNVLDIPQKGTINIHPSLLPKYRGASPVQSAILNGDRVTGISFLQMDQELDHGPIISQLPVTLSQNETLESLHKSLFQTAADELPTIIEAYTKGLLSPVPQNDSKAIYCEKITRQDGFFSIDSPPAPEIIDRMVRAYYPWPTAWTRARIKNEEVRIKLLPGKKVQVEGKHIVSVKDFLNGHPELRDKISSIV